MTFSSQSHAESFKPTDDNQVIETLAKQGLATALPPELRSQRLASQKTPDDLNLAIPLVVELLSFGKKTSDPRFYGEAEAILRPWWNLAAPPPQVLVHRANIRQFNHQFDAALEDLATYLTAVPEDSQARVMEATIFQVTGRYQKAAESCGKLLTRRSSMFKSLCQASARAMTEDPRPIFVQLKLLTKMETKPIVPSTNPTSVPSSEELFALGILADIALQLDDVAGAEEALRRILAAQALDIYATITLADLLLDLNRPDEAANLACKSPDHDGLLLRCGRGVRLKDAARFKTILSALGERFAAETRRQSPAHLRERAYFQLYLQDDPRSALASAQENYRTQKEPVDARLLVEAAAQMKSREAAQPVLDWMDSTRYSYRSFITLGQTLGGRK